jgi:SEC-C motif
MAMGEAFDAVHLLATILIEHGPLHENDIVRRLQDRGVADADSLWEDVLDENGCATGYLTDGRWIWLPAVLAGRVFTHRVGAAELAHDLLTVTPDLDPITALCEHEQYRRLADGSPAQLVMAGFDDELLEQRGIPSEVVDPHGALLLAPGTLTALGVAEGDVVGVRLTAEGLVVERVTDFADSPVGNQLAAMVGAGKPVLVDAAVWTACVEDPALFTKPLAPLCEIVEHAGLTRRTDWLAPGGFDFDRWQFDRGCTTMAERHDIDADDAATLYSLVTLYDQISMMLMEAATDADALPEEWPAEDVEGATQREPDEFASLIRQLGAQLADPLLAELLVAETIDRRRGGAAALGMFADVLEPKVPRAARVACRWLGAVALERIGDIAGAERELLTAESMDPDWPLPLVELARIASDRGDTERGLSLLHRAGAGPDHPLVGLLERHRPQPRRDLGRNEPCWCGSGRKYKKCHLGRETLPLAERADWLYAKAADHVLNGGWVELLTEVAYERARYAVDDDDPEALADPLCMDVVLFEGGAFADFLVRRGSLLPDDEQQLADQWLGVSRSVFEVEQVHRGQGFTVRDVRTGDRHEVSERTASRQLTPGQLICARVVPVGDSTMQIFGGLEPIALHERGPLIDLLDAVADPVSLVAALSRRFAPPTLTNTEGDPLMMCEATVRVEDPAKIEAALDETYDRVEAAEPSRWFEHVTTHGMARVRAALALDGDTLRVETNSVQRMDRVLATLARLEPDLKVLNKSRRTPDEVAAMVDDTSEGALDPDDPAVAAALEEFIRNYESKWLDEPIPALDGHTPRQAADDPTRRADLMKLLDTFPAGDYARGGMDADRLRAALGLG